jgi:hypothetical protein
MLMCWLRLADQATQDARESNSLLHGTAGRCGRQCLEVEWQVVLDRGTRRDWLDLESSTDVGEHGWAEWERFGVVLLPSLVFRSQVKGARVLEIWRQNNGLVASLARKLNTEIPRVKRDEREIQVLGGQMFGGKSIEAADGIAESACIADMLPGQSGEAGYRREETSALRRVSCSRSEYVRELTAERSDRGVDRLDKDAFAVELFGYSQFSIL